MNHLRPILHVFHVVNIDIQPNFNLPLEICNGSVSSTQISPLTPFAISDSYLLDNELAFSDTASNETPGFLTAGENADNEDTFPVPHGTHLPTSYHQCHRQHPSCAKNEDSLVSTPPDDPSALTIGYGLLNCPIPSIYSLNPPLSQRFSKIAHTNYPNSLYQERSRLHHRCSREKRLICCKAKTKPRSGQAITTSSRSPCFELNHMMPNRPRDLPPAPYCLYGETARLLYSKTAKSELGKKPISISLSTGPPDSRSARRLHQPHVSPSWILTQKAPLGPRLTRSFQIYQIASLWAAAVSRRDVPSSLSAASASVSRIRMPTDRRLIGVLKRYPGAVAEIYIWPVTSLDRASHHTDTSLTVTGSGYRVTGSTSGSLSGSCGQRHIQALSRPKPGLLVLCTISWNQMVYLVRDLDHCYPVWNLQRQLSR
ncbi:unnamed protein product [Protopolystoma xenopodis]|uniref:Uncharacterized protein n=1 Tax=Protopolystoma xenopodis TaxID=117903 RepID=A0A3S4ZGA9_9PLAT|nr:unnamed protein product [Protopolystoma xenopodis]